MDLYYGRRATGTIERAGTGWRDGTVALVMRVQPAATAPAGFGRQAAFGPLWLIVRHDGRCRVTLTPVLDGAVRDDLAEIHDVPAAARMTDEVLKLLMSQPVTWPGDAAPFSQQALRAVLGSVRAELTPLESAIVDPVGNDNALLFVATALTGNAITIAYVDPEGPDELLSVDVDGTAITVNLATDDEEAITSTAAEIQAAIEASGAANALVDVTIVDSDGGESVGEGIVTAMDATTLEAGDVYALGGFELAARPVGVGGRSIPAASA